MEASITNNEFCKIALMPITLMGMRANQRLSYRVAWRLCPPHVILNAGRPRGGREGEKKLEICGKAVS
jgi:hypothetical protein